MLFQALQRLPGEKRRGWCVKMVTQRSAEQVCFPCNKKKPKQDQSISTQLGKKNKGKVYLNHIPKNRESCKFGHPHIQ